MALSSFSSFQTILSHRTSAMSTFACSAARPLKHFSAPPLSLSPSLDRYPFLFQEKMVQGVMHLYELLINECEIQPIKTRTIIVFHKNRFNLLFPIMFMFVLCMCKCVCMCVVTWTIFPLIFLLRLTKLKIMNFLRITRINFCCCCSFPIYFISTTKTFFH